MLPQYLEQLGVNFKIVESDTYSIVKRVLEEGQDDVFPLLTAASRHSLPHGEGTGAPRSRSGTIARHPRNVLPEFLHGGKPEGDATEADLGQRRTRRHPPAGLRARKDIVKYARERDFPIILRKSLRVAANLQRAVVGA